MKTDTELQLDVLDELNWEPSVDAAEIGVTVDCGVVTLRGFVPTYKEKMNAERATKRVQGVRAVANDIMVRLSGNADRTDSDIAKASAEALEWDVSVPSDRIKVTVRQGWVNLEGTVDWKYQKEAAERAVHNLLGVRGVASDIAIRPLAKTDDIKTRIERAFLRNADLEAQQIQVETHNGTVVLRGDVNSWAEREEAERTTWAAPGVSHVENLISVTHGRS